MRSIGIVLLELHTGFENSSVEISVENGIILFQCIYQMNVITHRSQELALNLIHEC